MVVVLNAGFCVISCCVSALVRISCCGLLQQNNTIFDKQNILVHMQGVPLACEFVRIVRSMQDHSVLLQCLCSVCLKTSCLSAVWMILIAVQRVSITLLRVKDVLWRSFSFNESLFRPNANLSRIFSCCHTDPSHPSLLYLHVSILTFQPH